MYGPIHFTVVAFDDDQVVGGLLEQINAVRTAGVIRLIDFMFVTRDRKGNLLELDMTDLTPEERIEFGGVVGGLIGLGAAGVDGMIEGAEVGEIMASENDFGLLAEDLKEVLHDIPQGTSAMVVLFEHTWAIPLKEYMIAHGGSMLAQGLISPLDLVAVGVELAEAAEAERELEELEALEEMEELDEIEEAAARQEANAKKVKGTKKTKKKASTRKKAAAHRTPKKKK